MVRLRREGQCRSQHHRRQVGSSSFLSHATSQLSPYIALQYMFIVVILRVVVLQVAGQNGSKRVKTGQNAIWLIRLDMSGSEKLTDGASGLM